MPQLKLSAIESERGDLNRIIPLLLQKHGSQSRVAKELGVTPSTIGLWLKDNGYVRKSVWVKENQTL